MATTNFDSASLYFNKAKLIYTKLNIPDTAELFTLQTGLIYTSKKKLDLALAVFKTIIAKPDSPELSNTKAEALYQTGSFESLKSERLGIDDYTKFKGSERLKEIVQTNNENIEQAKASKFSKLISILAIALISILSLLSLAIN